MFKKISSHKHLRKTFYSYLLSFTVISTCIILIIALISYTTTASAISEEIVLKQSQNLNNKRQNLVNACNHIIETSYTIGLNNAVILYAKNQDNRYLKNEIISQIEQIDANDNHIMAIEIHLETSDHILSSSGARQIINKSLTDSWLSVAKSESKSQLWTKSFYYFNEDYEKIPVISYIQTLPIGSKNILGHIAIHTKETYYNEQIKSKTDDVILIDYDGEILSSSTINHIGTTYDYTNLPLILESPLDEGFITTNASYDHRIINFIKLDQIPWTIISETPYTAITSRTKPLLTTIVLLSLGALIGSFILSYLLTLKLYAPIKRLMAITYDLDTQLQTTLNKNITPKNELSYLGNVLDNITHSSKNMKKELYAHEPLLIDRFIRDLITNKYLNKTVLEQRALDVKLDFHHSNYTLFIISLTDYEHLSANESHYNIDTFMFAVKNVVTELMNTNDTGLCSESSKGQILCLFNYDEYPTEMTYLYSFLQQVQKTLKELLLIDSIISVGSTYKTITNIHLAYEEALDIMNHKMIFNESILIYDDYNKHNLNDYYYPVQLMLALSNATKKSDIKSISTYISNIFSDLREKKNLSYDNTYKVLTQLIDLLQKCISELGFTTNVLWGSNYKLYHQLDKFNSLDDMETWFKKIYSDLATHILNNSTCDNHHIGKIKDFIDKSYANDIYLSLIADEVGLNVSYMSRIFKQSTGLTVFEYITQSRINKSKNLLINSVLTVKEIALHVGYNNTQSYIKYFKTYERMTPGKYRKTFKISD